MITNDELLKAHHDGFEKGIQLGLALGRFYERHGITDKIPPELAEEVNTVVETALAKNLDSEYGAVKILLNVDNKEIMNDG